MKQVILFREGFQIECILPRKRNRFSKCIGAMLTNPHYPYIYLYKGLSLCQGVELLSRSPCFQESKLLASVITVLESETVLLSLLEFVNHQRSHLFGKCGIGT